VNSLQQAIALAERDDEKQAVSHLRSALEKLQQTGKSSSP
jgi:hypothetical protein